jgi:hypothetical protein
LLAQNSTVSHTQKKADVDPLSTLAIGQGIFVRNLHKVTLSHVNLTSNQGTGLVVQGTATSSADQAWIEVMNTHFDENGRGGLWAQMPHTSTVRPEIKLNESMFGANQLFGFYSTVVDVALDDVTISDTVSGNIKLECEDATRDCLEILPPPFQAEDASFNFGDGFHICGADTITANQLRVRDSAREGFFLFSVGSFLSENSDIDGTWGYRMRPNAEMDTSFGEENPAIAAVEHLPVPEKVLWGAPTERY